jgi:hypothetical protein
MIVTQLHCQRWRLGMARFKKVKKDDQYKDIPAKYLAGAKKKSKRAAEIRRTRRLYKMSKLSPADYDRISRERARG